MKLQILLMVLSCSFAGAVAEVSKEKHERNCRLLCPTWAISAFSDLGGQLACVCSYDEMQASDQEKYQKRQWDDQIKHNLPPPNPQEMFPELKSYEIHIQSTGPIGGGGG